MKKTETKYRRTRAGIRITRPQTSRTSRKHRTGPPEVPSATAFRISLLSVLDDENERLTALTGRLRKAVVFATNSEDAIDYDLCRKFVQRATDALGASLLIMRPPTTRDD